MAKETQKAPAKVDHNRDRYPELRDAISRFLDSGNLPDGPVERVELTFLANGEGNCRVWPARAEEPDSVFLPDPQLS